MKATITHNNENFEVDFAKPLDVSLPITNTDDNPIAWYLEKPVIEPVKMGEWTGNVASGASTNFNNVSFNPHGHATHTECIGHITRDFYSINKALTTFFFVAELISILPEQRDADFIITAEQIKTALSGKSPEAIVIRTLPNNDAKKSRKYSNTNPPYLDVEAANFIREVGIKHLLIDLPSVDREHDEGKLVAHKAFWNLKDVDAVNDDARLDATISELIFVDNSVTDGKYLLNLQIASFENDASPSKPILYKISE